MPAPEIIVPEWHLEIAVGEGQSGTDLVEIVGPGFRRKACLALAGASNDGWNPTAYESYECALFRAPQGFEVRHVSHTVGEYGHHSVYERSYAVEAPPGAPPVGFLHRVERVCDGTPEFRWTLPTHPPRFESDGAQLFLVLDFRRLPLPVKGARAAALFGTDAMYWVSVESADGATSLFYTHRPLHGFEPGSESMEKVRAAGEVARWTR